MAGLPWYLVWAVVSSVLLVPLLFLSVVFVGAATYAPAGRPRRRLCAAAIVVVVATIPGLAIWLWAFLG